MHKRLVVAGLLFVLFSLGSVLLLIQKVSPDDQQNVTNETVKASTEMVLFYGDGCPHCKIVDAYIKDNNIKAIVSFEEKEVYNNKTNAAQLIEKAEVCGISTESVGVPFLWTGSTCLVGDGEIIDFFKAAAQTKKYE